MFSYLVLISLLIVSCLGYAEYELFKGFDATEAHNTTEAIHRNLTTHLKHNKITKITTLLNRHKLRRSTKKIPKTKATTLPSTTKKQLKPKNKTTFKCPEEESPKNIGPYEVPTQNDLVMLTKHVLLKLYYGYNQESLQLLKDIKEATKAALATESKCHFNKKSYTECVKKASKHYERYTKDTLINLEAEKFNVSLLIENKICSLNDMDNDPLELIKLIAQEKSTLHFALPGFLILLHSCKLECSRAYTSSIKRTPIRHMTDQDLVINHLLTKKSYIQLINDSKHKV